MLNMRLDMPYPKHLPTVCSSHGPPTQRASCQECNRAYMRLYLRTARKKNPVHALWSRAKERARRLELTFDLKIEKLTIPERCPALGITLVVGEARSKNSPSLDRIIPTGGYVEGNVRVLSDQANRLKSNLNQAQLRERSVQASQSVRREDYRKLAAYAEREALLNEVRNKAAQGGRAGDEWSKIAAWLERRFAAGEVD
jgi:hypothetical protein